MPFLSSLFLCFSLLSARKYDGLDIYLTSPKDYANIYQNKFVYFLLKGVKQIKQAAIPARFVFIKPPSLNELERRLRGRGTETEDSIQKRLHQARAELEYADTPGVHDKIIVNDDLETAYKELDDWVYQKP